jgi:hypothetical protein
MHATDFVSFEESSDITFDIVRHQRREAHALRSMAPSISDSPPHNLLTWTTRRERPLITLLLSAPDSMSFCESISTTFNIVLHQCRVAYPWVARVNAPAIPEPAALPAPLTWTTQRKTALTTSQMSAPDYLSFGESSDTIFKTAPRQRSAAHAVRIRRYCTVPTYQPGNHLTNLRSASMLSSLK